MALTIVCDYKIVNSEHVRTEKVYDVCDSMGHGFKKLTQNLKDISVSAAKNCLFLIGIM